MPPELRGAWLNALEVHPDSRGNVRGFGVEAQDLPRSGHLGRSGDSLAPEPGERLG